MVLPICRYSRVLVAVGSARLTGCHAPMLAMVCPVAICSSEVPPPLVHVKSTGSLLVFSGENSWIGSLNTAARLWIGAVETGPGAAGVLPESASVWSVLLAASSANDRLACRVPAAVGVNATCTVSVLPAAATDPVVPVGTVRAKSPGFRPARYARSTLFGAATLLV